ncbi:MAG: GNAT family N-acetyltransferase [Hyphomonadaceae bacterium]|nr:GNAT family N-acetyltransferase [Hyphomonadaceae bacterium]
MSAPPKTILDVSPEEAEAIREAVRRADLSRLGEGYTLAGPEHVAGLVDFLSDPAVSDPIYDLPRPLTYENVAAWLEDAERLRQAGEALLVVAADQDGRIWLYSWFSVWPDRSAAEIAGAHRADHQNAGLGKAGAARSFNWMFETLGVRLVCVTAAIDNVRSARVIEAAGFVAMGERDGVRPDGSIRRSLYWEMTRDAW